MYLRIAYRVLYGTILAQMFPYTCLNKHFVQRDSGDHIEIDDDPNYFEHAYAELSRWPHPFIGAGNETTKPMSTLDITHFEPLLRPLGASGF